MFRRPLISMWIGVLFLAGFSTAVVWRSGTANRESENSAATASPVGQRRGMRRDERGLRSRPLALPEEATDAPALRDGTNAVREERRRMAGVLREAIEQARRARLSSDGVVDSSEADGPTVDQPSEMETGSLPREYIMDAIHAMQPLLTECYELALHEDATLRGTYLTEFVVGGEAEIGGVIESAEVLEESRLRHPVLDECFQETLYTLELPAPEGGGQLTVRYPFVLEPSGNMEAVEATP